MMNKCKYCDGQLIWMSDDQINDKIITYFHCLKCDKINKKTNYENI
jgi:hypothetical protein